MYSPVRNVARSLQRCCQRQQNFDAVSRYFWGRPYYPSIPVEIDRASRYVERELRSFDREMNRFCDEFHRLRPFRFPRIFRDEAPIKRAAEDGSRQLSIKVDVSQYKPEEVKVTVTDNVLNIIARHDEVSNDGAKVFREYVRQYSLPEDIMPETIRSLLSNDGTLTIEGHLQAIGRSRHRQEQEILVEHAKTEAPTKN